MSVEAIERDFKRAVGDDIRLSPEGDNRFRVFTRYMFDDGDHLIVVLRKENDHWLLSDEGHTQMHRSYDAVRGEADLDIRRKAEADAEPALIEDRNGELILPIPDERFGDALSTFVHALLQISSVS